MNKYDYLRKHALSNVFISPTQDKQCIIEPFRLTPVYGKKKFATVDLWSSISLPDEVSTWHVYQIGAIHPTVLNFFIKCDDWTSLADTCNDRGMMADAYVASGLQLPRFDTFYRYTENGSLVLAVKNNDKLKIDFDKEPVFIRVYSDAYFNSDRFADLGISKKIEVYGKILTTPADNTEVLQKEDTLVNLGVGLVTRFVNGVLVKTFVGYPFVIGDIVELVFDSSVFTTIEWKVKDLEAFESILDKKRKLLLHRPKDNSLQIDYQDDIDVYLIQKIDTPQGGVEYGVYYHKNEEDSLRNLTHRDYSIVPSYIREFANTIEKQFTPRATFPADNMFVRLHIRNAGVKRELKFEHQRILELYKLNDAEIIKAMVGLDSTVDVWQAENLENSDFMSMLRSTFHEVTVELAEKAYMYNAASKYLADTPVKITPSPVLAAFELPLRARHGCTVYEYDDQGLLIGWHHHYTGLNYVVKSDLTAYAEVIVGWGGDVLDETPDVRTATLNEVYGYRVYSSNRVGNNFTKYKDITGTDKYTVTNGLFEWQSNDTTEYPLLRSDARFYAKDYEIFMTSGQLEIELTVKQNRGNGLALYKMDVPLGQLDVFLNKRSLIRGLDYFYREGKIIITNKEYLNDPLRLKQNIHVRFAGFCKKDLSIMEEGDVGFIEHGLLSNNNRYDIRDDKVQRVIVGGRFYHKNDLIFSEFHNGVSITDEFNGLPYLVKDILVPVKPYTVSDTYELRDKSIATDKVVSDYMTIKLPQPPRGDLVAIPRRYQVFSPFITKLIMDLRLGYLRIPPTAKGYNRQEVLDICKPYEYLLEADPIKDPNSQDIRYVVIHPHPMPYVIELNLNSYRFIHKVVEEYCRGLVTLSPSIKTA